MGDDIRVRRNMIDVRHEYLANDGNWLQGACHKRGFCRECNRDGEKPVSEFAFLARGVRDVSSAHMVRFIICAHLDLPFINTSDRIDISATPFRRLSIACTIAQYLGVEIDDDAILAAHSIRDIMILAGVEVA